MDALLTLDQVARLLQVPLGTLRFWRHKGTGPRSIKVGGHVRYRQVDVQAYIDSLAGAH